MELAGAYAGRKHPIAGRQAIIGRSPAAEVRLDKLDVSREHARLYVDARGHWNVEDLGSRNGICINGTPVIGDRIEHGDRLQIGGNTLFMFGCYDQLEEQIAQFRRAESSGTEAAGIAHDFNNLLSVLVSTIDLLQQHQRIGTVASSLLDECLADMRDATNRSKELVAQLLRLAQSKGSNSQAPQIDCTRLLDRVATLCRRTFGPTYEFNVSIDAGLLVRAHPVQLKQVVMNLLVNARDAMPTGGKVRVHADTQLLEAPTSSNLFLSPGRYVRIDIEDQGEGMDAHTSSRVFEPFFTTKGAERGTGLGLSIVQTLVRENGGRIQVRSEPGVGTTFTILLPAATPDNKPASTPTPSREPERHSFTSKLLLVDDDPHVLRAYARLLREIGYDVLVATNGREALRRYSAHHPEIELVLLDVAMPVLDGYATFSELRKYDPAARVLLFSGCVDTRVATLIDAGACGFLPKPCGSEALKRAISTALN